MQHQAKKFILIIAALMYGFLGIIIVINYVIDPFEVAQSQVVKPVQEFINQRVYKLRVLEKKHKDFDSYILGTSRVQELHPEYVEKYIPGSHFYNLSFHLSSLGENLLVLSYMLKNQYIIKNLLVELDPAALFIPLAKDSDPQWAMSLLPPSVIHSLTHVMLYYKINYTQLMFEQLWYKWTHRNAHSPEILFDSYGVTNWISAERQIKEDPEKYIRSMFPREHLNDRAMNNSANLKMHIKDLKALTDICREYHIRCIFMTPPMNKHDLDRWDIDYMARYMREAVKITDFWNFIDYNVVTTDDHNYLDLNHYRAKIIPLIMARIFNDPSVDVPADFGTYVNAGNISTVEARLRRQAASRDATWK